MQKQLNPNEQDRSCRGRRAAAWLLVVGLFWPSSLLPGGAGAQEVAPSIESPARVGTVVFPHLYHVDELGFECGDCHHETSAAALRTPHPEYFEDFWIECQSCHRRGEDVAEPQSCGSCHANGSEVDDETLSAKVVIHRSCWACHEIGTGQEASRGCSFCHEVNR